MIPKNNLLGINRDIILQNNEGSTLNSSTAIFISNWTNRQFQMAGEASSSPGSFFGIIHYASTNTQGGLITSTIADGDPAIIITSGQTFHNYQQRVESTWSIGDTLYLALGVGDDGKLTNVSPTSNVIEVGRCLIDAGASEDALIEIFGWKSTLRTKDAVVDTDANKIYIITGDGGVASSSNAGDGGNVDIIGGAGGAGTASYNGGVGSTFGFIAGIGGVAVNGVGGAGGAFTVGSGAGGESSNGDAGDGGAFNTNAGDGGNSLATGDGGSGGILIMGAGDGGTSVDALGGAGGAVTIGSGAGGNSTNSTGGVGGNYTVTLGIGGNGTTGGAGGAFSFTTGTGGDGTTTGGDGGSFAVSSNVGGDGATAGIGGSFTLTAGDGGPNSVDSAPRTAGVGGALTLQSGQGGANTTATGGIGGASGVATFSSNNGGASTYGTAGNAGNVTVQSGQGGASTDGTAGDGGSVSIIGGAGGYHATASNSYTPGSAGALNLTGGKGGLGSTTVIGADGADVNITGGAGGDDRGANDGDGGNVVIDGGVGDTNGSVSIGATNAATIASGSGSTVWTHSGDLTVTGSISGTLPTHASTHQNGGSDEISVTGLSGLLGDAQTPAAHLLGSAYHSADTLANLNSKVSDATLFGSAYGEMYIDDNSSSTSLSAEPTFTRITSTYTAGLVSSFSLVNGSGGSAGALQYTGSLTKVFKVTVSISAGASAADTIAFRVAINGTTNSKSEARRYMSASNDEGVVILTCLVSLTQNDYVEIFAARVGATANITVDEMNVNISAIS